VKCDLCGGALMVSTGSEERKLEMMIRDDKEEGRCGCGELDLSWWHGVV
jgi:hypothetical protein